MENPTYRNKLFEVKLINPITYRKILSLLNAYEYYMWSFVKIEVKGRPPQRRALLPMWSWPGLINSCTISKAALGRSLPETSNANYFGTVWRREISLPRAHIIIISPAIYIFCPVINARVVSLSDTGFRKWPDFINWLQRDSREGRVTVLSEFLFDLLHQGVVCNWPHTAV